MEKARESYPPSQPFHRECFYVTGTSFMGRLDAFWTSLSPFLPLPSSLRQELRMMLAVERDGSEGKEGKEEKTNPLSLFFS